MAVVARSRDRTVSPGNPGWPTDATRWLLAGIMALGILVRFSTLAQQSFWFDEATTWGIVAHGLGHVLSTVPKTESTPPLYYVLLWLWAQVFGHGEAGLRSFSAVCSTLTIPVVWMIGRRVASERAGLVAALLTAVNPLLFWYAQEARSYSLLLLLSAISVLAFVRALESPRWPRLLTWGLASALALAAHYYAAVLIAPEAAWLALRLHRRGQLTPGRVLAGAGPVVAVGAALLPLLIRQNDGRAGYIATQEGSLPYRVAQLVKEDIIGQGQPAKALLTAIGVGLVGVGLALLLTRSRRAERAAGLRLLCLGVAGVVIAVALALVGTDYVNTRNLLPTWPALAVPVAIGLSGLRGRRTAALATTGLVVLSLLCVYNIVSESRFQRPDWRGAARTLGAASSPRAVVSDVQGRVTLEPYLRRLGPFPAAGQAVREVDVIWVQRRYQWGPLAALTPVALPGFPRMSVRRTASFIVVRYRAPTPQPVSPTSLDRLYPLAAQALALVQRG